MPELNQESPETAKPAATEPASAEPSKLKTLADLFREDEPSEQDDTAPASSADGTPAERQSKGKPKGLKDAAERLGLKPEDLYAIEVPMSDGKTKTLGQLKDLATKEEDISVRELQFEESRTKRESELIRDRNELQELIGLLPQTAIKPEVREAMRQKHELRMKSERAKTLEVIPEWQDEARRDEEAAGMVEHLTSYGLPKTFLLSAFDHRLVKYVRENWLREKRIKAALEKVETVKPSGTKSSKANGAPKKPADVRRKDDTSQRARLLNLMQ